MEINSIVRTTDVAGCKITGVVLAEAGIKIFGLGTPYIIQIISSDLHYTDEDRALGKDRFCIIHDLFLYYPEID